MSHEEARLWQLMDFQKFAGNAKIDRMIREIEERSVQALEDEQLFAVSAAGEAAFNALTDEEKKSHDW